MIKFNKKQTLSFTAIIFIFIAIGIAYFPLLLEGKKVQQADMKNYSGMSKEIKDFKEATGEKTLWTNSMFCGMPTYLINNQVSKYNYALWLQKIISFDRWRPFSHLFLGLIGFFITLLLFGVNKWLAIAGAIAYAFSSYFIIIIDAGHVTKAIALNYLPPIIGGFWYAMNKNRLTGTIVLTIALALQLVANHLQITYYTFLVILVLGVFQLVYDIKNKRIKPFLYSSGMLLFGAVLALSVNFTSIYFTYDYGKDSLRGKSELTHNIGNKTSGLDKDYATAWSYGKAETFNLLVPNLMGGASGGALSKNSATYKYFKNRTGEKQAEQIIKQLPLYWGPQPFTSGPVYIGAFIILLFVLGMFILDNRIKWWIFTATLLSIFLAWGKYFFLTDLFLDFFPGYNKFRTVSMTLVIAEFTMPLLGILALQEIISKKVSQIKLFNGLKWSLGIVGGILLILIIAPSAFFDFVGSSDAKYTQSGYPMDLIQADRLSLLRSDAIRSLVFVLLGAGLIFMIMKDKLQLKYAYIGFAVLILVDLWQVDKRYLNNDDFVSKTEAKIPYKKTRADATILQDKSLDYRVFNMSLSTFNDASTSYFHKSIGGYHGAKLRRYQDIIDFHISKNNMSVLNMLNTKYFIVPTKDQGPMPQKNPDALGNVWFVNKYKFVEDPDAEIAALTDFNPKEEAIIDKRFTDDLKTFTPKIDSTRNIKLIDYKPNHLTYTSSTKSDQLAVFSEVYYSKGWNAYIDGKLNPHFRVNYILRSMIVPSGNHKIEFKFEPAMSTIGNIIVIIGSLLTMLLIAFAVYSETKKSE